jgi:uncharacterized OsmC-like protein
MQELPHHYAVRAVADTDGVVTVESHGLPALQTAAPAEFGGPGDLWSPETLLVASVGNCFILTFRAIAKASRAEWTALRCEVDGVLDRVERRTLFTGFRVRAVLDVPGGASEDKLLRLLEKAEQGCLITNSLTATVHLDAEVRIADRDG